MPAAITLIEKKEIQKKHKAGLHGTRRGRVVAAVDAAGTAMVWRLLRSIKWDWCWRQLLYCGSPLPSRFGGCGNECEGR